jgi:tryptophanase
LYLAGGIRSVEVGSVMFGKYNDQGALIPATNDLVRLAIPRRVYTQSHIEYVIEVFDHLLKHKNEVKGYKIIEEPKFLRHFTAKFEKI